MLNIACFLLRTTRPLVSRPDALQIRSITDKVQKMLHDAFEAAKDYKPKKVRVGAGWASGWMGAVYVLSLRWVVGGWRQGSLRPPRTASKL